MDKEKTVIIAEKVKAFAIAFIGVCFFGIGTTYFQERMTYRLPRILGPVLDLFGNVALAIAMLILGIALIYYGFTIWKKVSTKTSLFWIISVVGIAAGTVFMQWSDRQEKAKASVMMDEIYEDRQEQIDEIRNTDMPDLKNSDAEKYLAEFDVIYKRYEQNLADQDPDAIDKSIEEYGEWSSRAAPIMDQLSNEKKAELAKYMAKLAIQWHDLSVSE